MTKLSEIRLTKFGWFLTIGCLFPIVFLFLAPFLLLGLFEIDDIWEAKWTSFSFEKKTYWVDNVFGYMGVEEIAIENENTFTLFGASDSTSKEEPHPIAIRTTDGGKNWKTTKDSINFRDAQFFHRGDSVFMVRYLVNTKYNAEHPVYVSTGDYMNWEYFGNTEYSGRGYARVKQEDSSFERKSFLLKKENRLGWIYEEQCQSSGKKYAQNDENWIICGYDKPSSSIHEVRILHKHNGEYKIHSSFPNKWHIFTAVGMNPSDFYVEDSLFVGLLDFNMDNAGVSWLHYLYYSTDGGKSWHNRKLPKFSEERLLVTEDKILILGLDEYSRKDRIYVSILTMPKPKR
ncbi:MAG: hypothetical protein IJ734_07995 [Fibrobacter sp.]|nr:hypothetical protein [Fibrobacter sp.]